MSDEHHFQDLQDWFHRSVEELPPQPFTLAVLERVRRRERTLRWQLYAAQLAVLASFSLLLPKLIVLLNTLAALPVALAGAGGERWPLLVLLALAAVWWPLRHAYRAGFLRGLPWQSFFRLH